MNLLKRLYSERWDGWGLDLICFGVLAVSILILIRIAFIPFIVMFIGEFV